MSWACCKPLSHATKIAPCKSALREVKQGRGSSPLVIILRLLQVAGQGGTRVHIPRMKLVRTVWIIITEKIENSTSDARVLQMQNLKFDHFTSLPGRER